MNITLSADKSLVEKSREYAKKHNTSLNQLVRDYLQRLANEGEVKQISSEFEDLAKNYSGESSVEYTFNRDEIYSRGL